ncbi:MAG: signal peptidase I [Oscillospiraceae bacterium]|jgi:signal peptidase|nr:signal peptidase I [Oscillospiraceae bacterium]
MKQASNPNPAGASGKHSGHAGKKEKSQNTLLNLMIILLSLLLVLAILPLALTNVISGWAGTWYGFRPVRVTTESMSPTILPGALVIDRAVPFADLKEGNVITFTKEDGKTLNTHRIVEDRGVYKITKGDHNPTSDSPPVSQSNYRYKTIVILNFVTKINTVQGFLLYVAAPLGGLALLSIIICIIVYAARAGKQRKKNQRENGENQKRRGREHQAPEEAPASGREGVLAVGEPQGMSLESEAAALGSAQDPMGSFDQPNPLDLFGQGEPVRVESFQLPPAREFPKESALPEFPAFPHVSSVQPPAPLMSPEKSALPEPQLPPRPAIQPSDILPRSVADTAEDFSVKESSAEESALPPPHFAPPARESGPEEKLRRMNRSLEELLMSPSPAAPAEKTLPAEVPQPISAEPAAPLPEELKPASLEAPAKEPCGIPTAAHVISERTPVIVPVPPPPPRAPKRTAAAATAAAPSRRVASLSDLTDPAGLKRKLAVSQLASPAAAEVPTVPSVLLAAAAQAAKAPAEETIIVSMLPAAGQDAAPAWMDELLTVLNNCSAFRKEDWVDRFLRGCKDF